jgi:hypothetical protein
MLVRTQLKCNCQWNSHPSCASTASAASDVPPRHSVSTVCGRGRRPVAQVPGVRVERRNSDSCHPEGGLCPKDPYHLLQLEPLATFYVSRHDPSLRPKRPALRMTTK